MIKSDLKRIDNLRDEDIDYSDIPELTDEQLSRMRPLGEVFPEFLMDAQTKPRHNVTISLDEEVITYFETQAKVNQTNYLTLINAALKNYILDQRMMSASTA